MRSWRIEYRYIHGSMIIARVKRHHQYEFEYLYANQQQHMPKQRRQRTFTRSGRESGRKRLHVTCSKHVCAFLVHASHSLIHSPPHNGRSVGWFHFGSGPCARCGVQCVRDSGTETLAWCAVELRPTKELNDRRHMTDDSYYYYLFFFTLHSHMLTFIGRLSVISTRYTWWLMLGYTCRQRKFTCTVRTHLCVKCNGFVSFLFFFYIFRTLLSTADVPRLEFIEHVDFAETALHFMFHRKKTKFVIITGPNLSCSAQLKEFLQMWT